VPAFLPPPTRGARRCLPRRLPPTALSARRPPRRLLPVARPSACPPGGARVACCPPPASDCGPSRRVARCAARTPRRTPPAVPPVRPPRPPAVPPVRPSRLRPRVPARLPAISRPPPARGGAPPSLPGAPRGPRTSRFGPRLANTDGSAPSSRAPRRPAHPRPGLFAGAPSPRGALPAPARCRTAPICARRPVSRRSRLESGPVQAPRARPGPGRGSRRACPVPDGNCH